MVSMSIRVPVVPNAARIRARVEGAAPAASGRVRAVVESADDVEGMPNFARDYVGHTVELQVPDGAPPAGGQPFRATVSFRGDEAGGQFVVKGRIEKD
jgi:hypothetical protein